MLTMEESPGLTSTPKGATKRVVKALNLETPHVPLAAGGYGKRNMMEVPEQLNVSNQSLPVDLDVSVSSSRRSVLKQLSQPKKTATLRQGTSWMYVNRKSTPIPNDRPLPPRRGNNNNNNDGESSILAPLPPVKRRKSSGQQLQQQLIRPQQKGSSSQAEVVNASENHNTNNNNNNQIKVRRPKKRAAPGTKALREIAAYQRSTSLLIRKLPFARYVRHIAVSSLGPRYLSFRWQAICFLALQEAAEAFIISLFESAQRCAIHANRVTVMNKDLKLVTDLQNIPTASQYQNLELSMYEISSRPAQLAVYKSKKKNRNDNNNNVRR